MCYALPVDSSIQIISGEHGTSVRGCLELGKAVTVSGNAELRLGGFVSLTSGLAGSSTNTENWLGWA